MKLTLTADLNGQTFSVETGCSPMTMEEALLTASRALMANAGVPTKDQIVASAMHQAISLQLGPRTAALRNLRPPPGPSSFPVERDQ
jgi:hypothetical protein